MRGEKPAAAARAVPRLRHASAGRDRESSSVFGNSVNSDEHDAKRGARSGEEAASGEE